jgi:signal transduction histidine kinase
MPEPLDEGSGRAPRRRRRRRRTHGGSAESASRPRRSGLSAEQQAYRTARRRASLKVSFLAHFVTYASVILFLTFIAGARVGLIVALAWGIGIVAHYFAAIVAPGLHRRFVEEEVKHQVAQGVSRERAAVRDRHTHTLEQLSASIAHEIRNPITAAKSLVQQMGEDVGSNENVGYAEVALEELDRVERSISHLLRFARDEDIRLSPVRLPDVVDSAVETFRDRIGRVGATIHEDIETDGVIQGDPEKLRRVIINLIGNALDALEQSGTSEPRIDLTAGENLAGSEVWVRIRDNGPGIDSESLAKIFSPFYTSKDDGTGLGLAISKKVIDAHGGSLEAVSSPGAGAEFVLTFPKQSPGSSRDPRHDVDAES